MIRTLFNVSATLLSIVIALFQTCGDFRYDYESHPYLPYDFEHIELNLTLDNEHNLLSGLAEYTLAAKIEGQTSILLHARELAIDDVSSDDSELEYRVSGDSLLIILPDTARVGESMNLSISWQTVSPFGLYSDYKSNFWSSKNPLAHHYWFPVFDHPRNELSVDAYFTIPTGMEVMFNGNLVDTELQSVSRKRVHWKTEKPVPVTGLGFAFGEFVISEATSGFSKVRLFSPASDFEQSKREELVREAAELKREIEDVLSFEYPWESLNMVVLPDNMWEERTHGSGIIYLYERLGNLESQLKRGLYAQWFGEYIRQEQFIDEAGNMDFLRTALHYTIEENSAFITNPDTLNSVYTWNRWQQGFLNNDLQSQVVMNSLPDLVREFNGVTSFDNIAELWYDETGIPWFELNLPEDITDSDSSAVITKYSLNTSFDESDGQFTLVFDYEQGDNEVIHSLTMTEYQFEESVRHEVLFTGTSDTVEIMISPTTEFVSFDSKSFDIVNLEFGEIPLFFLLNQLRYGDVSGRRLAAEMLRQYRDNPDLQLAMNDVLNEEESPLVKAEMLTTMAAITEGATGTEQQFIDALNNPDPAVQISALGALKNYSEDDYVKSQIRNKVLSAESDTVFNAALNSYLRVSVTEEVLSLANRLARIDSSGNKTLSVIEATDDTVNSDNVIEIADAFLNSIYPYTTREKALRFLFERDQNPTRWKTRFELLIEDRDPRIRFIVVEAVEKFAKSEALVALNNASQDEFDIRVLLQIDDAKESLQN